MGGGQKARATGGPGILPETSLSSDSLFGLARQHRTG
jgi:hypothetical protein